ncbi:sensor histidine kinase [Telmatospirillum sp. J64-1]|uniref:sensor histidine kinase n=1 Tax=Telmatospirillum sp. J64-1 TaxID=2502183 RepID=UPI00115D7116|nr:histidine kinase dimerization/phosphoacceptor domain -containing protein [Telmatospirillum sp. J64-1]
MLTPSRPVRADATWRLLLIALLSAISFTIYTAWSLYQTRTAHIEDTFQRNEVLAELLEEQALKVLSEAQGVLRYLSAELTSRDLHDPSLHQELHDWMNYFPDLSQLWVLDQDGRVTASSVTEAPQGFDFSATALYHAHARGADVYVSGLRKGAVSERWLFSVSMAVRDGQGAFRGVVVASVERDYFEAVYARLTLAPNDNIIITKTDGNVIALRLRDDGDTPLPSFGQTRLITEYLPQAPQGRLHMTSLLDDELRLGAYRSIRGWPLAVIVTSSKQDVLALWREDAIKTVSALVIGLSLLFLLTWWTAKAIQTKEAVLRQRSILLNEIHHRVKNNLAIIQSLLMLEASKVVPEARSGYEDSLSRVEAMALVHEILYQSENFAGLDGGDYINRLCTVLAASTGNRITLSADVEPRIVLELDQAMPLALLVNEAVSNSLKHAFPERQNGRIAVRLHRQGSDIVVEVEDDGIGFSSEVRQGKKSNLGLRLIRSLAAQLDGALTLENVLPAQDNRPASGGLLRLRFQSC